MVENNELAKFDAIDDPSHDVVVLGLLKKATEEWEKAFKNAKSREPTIEEVEAFKIGQDTPLFRQSIAFIASAILAGVYGVQSQSSPRAALEPTRPKGRLARLFMRK